MRSRRRSGCRDFAVLMMEAVRSLGLAAQFFSGYLYVPEYGGDGLVGGGATHAWLQVYQRWPGESGQGDKWIFCLRTARIAADQERA